MTRRGKVQRTPQSRVFTQKYGPAPANPLVYQTLARAQGVSWPQGERTPVRTNDPNRYGRHIVIDTITGAQGLPTLPVEVAMTRDLSEFLKLVRNGCVTTVQVHVGSCQNPSDAHRGWEKIHVLELAGITDYGTNDLGGFDPSTDAQVLETIPFQGEDYYEIKRLKGAAIASSEIVQEVVAVAICDEVSCGECGVPSDGCQRIFAIQKATVGSPGLTAELIYSSDQGATIGQTNITSLPANRDPSAMGCVGAYLVVLSNTDESLHYDEILDVLNGDAAFTRVATGFVASSGPNALFSMGRTFTWIVGDGGYVYFSDDITGGVEVKDAGATTTEDLLAIHGLDELFLVAVGANNTVIVSEDGGDTWSLITGPAPAVALNTVWVQSESSWIVGTAGGQLFYTSDAGANWTEKTFPGSGSGTVTKVVFATPSVGYMAHATATPDGRILRTIDGGNSWYVLPEQTGQSLPTHDRTNDLAACGEDPNFVLAGGLNANGSDGVLLKLA